MCVACELVEENVELSPKSQVKVYGAVPPETLPENVTVCPTSGLEGDDVKLTVKDGCGGGGELLSFQAVRG